MKSETNAAKVFRNLCKKVLAGVSSMTATGSAASLNFLVHEQIHWVLITED